MSIRPRRSLLNPSLKRPSALLSQPRARDRIWLDKNENFDSDLMTLASSILSNLSPISIAAYPEAGELYRKLGSWLNVSADSLLLTPGSDGGIRLAFEAFVEHDDPVVHTLPTFAMYPVYCQMFGADANAIEYLRGASGPELSVDEILAAVLSRRPKLLCIPNPDSPTGTIIAETALQTILSACEKCGTVLLIDEAYHPFYRSSVVSWTAQSENLIVVRTFAKAWGVAGLRIGYAVAHPATIALLHKMRPMYEVSTVAIDFMVRMLDHVPEMEAAVERIRAGKDYFAGEMRKLGSDVLSTHGNFVHVAFGARGPAIHAALANRVLYRANFEHPSLAGYSRFSIASCDVMARVVSLIQSAVDRS